MLGAEVKLYRIGVLPEAAPLNWTAIRKQSGMSSQIANRLAAAARKWGANPLDWYGSFSPVLESQWQAIEIFKNGWEKLTITKRQEKHHSTPRGGIRLEGRFGLPARRCGRAS